MPIETKRETSEFVLFQYLKCQTPQIAVIAYVHCINNAPIDLQQQKSEFHRIYIETNHNGTPHWYTIQIKFRLTFFSSSESKFKQQKIPAHHFSIESL